MFIACAWTSKAERRLFQLNPFVFKVDATCHTNNEKRHLLTFTSKSASAQSFIFLKVYLPDQKASTFRWVFQVAVPKLLGRKTYERVRYVMTDGDSHEFMELDKAIKNYFVNAFRGRCGWHIIHKGWKRYGIIENVVDPDRRQNLKHALNTILNWLFMFCRSGGCEDEEEYVLSKSLLLAFVHNHVAKALVRGSDKQSIQVETILKFLHNHVFVHEMHFIFYPRKNVLHFDETTNSSHEGTNNGIKSHSAAVLPSMDVSTSAQVLQFQTDIAMKEMDRYCCRNTVNTNLHALLPSANKVNPLLTSLLEQQWRRRTDYYVKRNVPTNFEWSVVLKEEHRNRFHKVDYEVNPYNKFIPKFQRVRIVNMNSVGEMKCSCCHFSRFGYGCIHVLSVILFENPSYKGYKHTDVRVFWWNDYNFYALREAKYEKGGLWNKGYMELLDNDIVGPSMPEDWACINFDAKSNALESTDNSIFALKPAVDRLQNYSLGQAKAALNIFTDVRNDGVATTVGYSQLCKVDAESEYECDGADNPFNIDMDDPTDALTAITDNTQRHI